MSPTIYTSGPYRFFFFSREESRPHIHVVSSSGEAKFWLEPLVSLTHSAGLSQHELKRLQKIVEQNNGKFRKAWKDFFKV